MSDKNPNPRASLNALLEERTKFETWLAQLEARRTDAVGHVFARVHADYSARLDDVRTRLAGEADAIVALVAELESRLAAEQELVTTKVDERAEAELRASVGEYSDKEWKSVSAKFDATIADGRARVEATEHQLADLQALLGSIVGASAPPRPSLERSAEVAVVEDLAGAGWADQGRGEPAADAEDGAVADAADVPEAADEPPSEEPAVRSSSFDELAFLRSVAGTPARPAPAAAVTEGVAAEPPKPKARPPRGRGTIDEPATRPRPQAPIPAPAEEGSALGGPTPRTSQAVRSLKCQECGTLNFPTEWYCERCGGELAAF